MAGKQIGAGEGGDFPPLLICQTDQKGVKSLEHPVANGFYSICIWVYRFAFLNLLWVLFTLAGGVVLGIFPATIAMFAVERAWIRGEKDLPVHQLFWSMYKREFGKSNLLGYLLTFVGTLLVINYFISATVKGAVGDVFTLLLLGLLLLYALIIIYIFPVYVHYDVHYLAYIKHAVVIGISSPLMSLLIGLSFIGYFYLVTLFPGILLLYTGSILSFLIMWFAYCRFTKIEAIRADKA